jgi:hypothetical protein
MCCLIHFWVIALWVFLQSLRYILKSHIKKRTEYNKHYHITLHVSCDHLINWMTHYVGWDWSLRTAAITGLLFIPQVNVSMEAMVMLMMPAGDTSWYLPELSGSPTSRDIWSEYLWYNNGSLTCHKILQHGASGFTSHPKEGVVRIFIALKNPSPQPGLNVWPFGLAASTPPRRLSDHYFTALHISQKLVYIALSVTCF